MQIFLAKMLGALLSASHCSEECACVFPGWVVGFVTLLEVRGGVVLLLFSLCSSCDDGTVDHYCPW